MSDSQTPPAAQPVYSEVMEDWSVIGQALAIAPADTVVCISSAGDNVFHAALEGCRHVFGVDIHPVQTAFCRLKEIAFRHLSWVETAQLMGVRRATPERRRRLLERLPLPPALAAFREPEAVALLTAEGLVGCGQLSAFVAPLRQGLAAAVGAEGLEAILRCGDAEERRRRWQEGFESEAVTGLLAAALNEQTISGAFIPGWAFPRMAERPFHAFYHRVLHHQLVELDPTENPFMHRLWRARFPSEEAVPPYLRRDRYRRLRQRCDAVSWHTAELGGFLATMPPGSVDAFNLSNILDWCEDEPYGELWRQVDRTAAPGARVFLRSFLADRALPAGLDERWRLDTEAATAMAAADRVGYYSRYELWTASA